MEPNEAFKNKDKKPVKKGNSWKYIEFTESELVWFTCPDCEHSHSTIMHEGEHLYVNQLWCAHCGRLGMDYVINP